MSLGSVPAQWANINKSKAASLRLVTPLSSSLDEGSRCSSALVLLFTACLGADLNTGGVEKEEICF